MANPKKGDSLMADKSGDPLFGDRQANIADAVVTVLTLGASAPATLSAGAPGGLDVTYSAGDPTNSPNGAITIADGATAMTITEEHIFLDEVEANLNLIETLAIELIADHATFKTLADELVTDHALVVTDLGVMSTKINAILDVLEEHGLMTES